MNSGMKLIAAAAFAALSAVPALAETVEVKMLNRGEKGSMVFEPDFVKLSVGDSVKFRATQMSHNAATVDGMVPEGAEGFKGKINEELEVRFDKPGYYGIKCSPHYGMGMVMLVKVGEAELPQSYREIKFPARAKPRFEEIFREATAQ